MKFKTEIVRETPVRITPVLKQVAGRFGIKPQKVSRKVWNVDLDLPDKWNRGVIIGQSGSGKSTIARKLMEMLGGFVVEVKDKSGNPVEPFKWPADLCVPDGFPVDEIGLETVERTLNGVGFSSQPDWVRPYFAQSTGQQFRINTARAICEARQRKVPLALDEYGGVVDIDTLVSGTIALKNMTKQSNLQVVTVGVREDHVEYFEPDWVMRVNADQTVTLEQSGDDRGLLRRSPPLEFKIIRADTSSWVRFRANHYLDHHINPSAHCYVAINAGGKDAAFTAVLHFPSPTGKTWREHRTVCKPEFQGCGIGVALSDFVASMYSATRVPYYSLTSHPAMIEYRRKQSHNWAMIRERSFAATNEETGGQKSFNRLTSSFKWIGPRNYMKAREFKLI